MSPPSAQNLHKNGNEPDFATSLFTPECSFNIAMVMHFASSFWPFNVAIESCNSAKIYLSMPTFKKTCIYNVVLQIKRGHQDAFVVTNTFVAWYLATTSTLNSTRVSTELCGPSDALPHRSQRGCANNSSKLEPVKLLLIADSCLWCPRLPKHLLMQACAQISRPWHTIMPSHSPKIHADGKKIQNLLRS